MYSREEAVKRFSFDGMGAIVRCDLDENLPGIIEEVLVAGMSPEEAERYYIEQGAYMADKAGFGD